MNAPLWEMLDEFRAQKQHYNPFDVLKEAKAREISVSFDDLRSLLSRVGLNTGGTIQPAQIVDFVISYFNDNGPKSILDGWAGMGSVLSPLVEKYKPAIAIGLNRASDEHEIAQLMQKDRDIKWKLGEPIDLLDQVTTRFDAVVGAPPFRTRSASCAFQLGNESIELRDDYASLLLLKASLLLNDSGKSLFVLAPRFLFARPDQGVINNLPRFGLCIDSVLHLPSGTFAPSEGVSGLFVIVRRGVQEKIFVAEITAEEIQRDVLLRNLKGRKEGKSPQLGALVDLDTFHSFPELVKRYEIDELTRVLGLPPVQLMDICTGVNLPKRETGAEFDDLPNSVYLPTIGNSHAVASLSELKIKPQNYVQLVVDANQAIATYLAQFLNTPFGRKLRESWTSGSVILKITKTNLTDATVFLPDLDVQIGVLTTQSAVTDISSRVETLSRELWNRPRKYKEIQKRVKSMQTGEDFIEWIESLPFPISSILWAYHADAEVEHKVEHLFLFFEALCEFAAVLMLSAYASDKEFYAQESGAWIENDAKYQDWVLTSTFGGWRNLGERLAKVTRRLREDKEKRDVCMRLFGNPTTEFLDMLTEKTLFAVLRDVNEFRNEWKGHSGVQSFQDHQKHLALLESKVSEIRRIMQDRWESTLLLYPGSNEYSEGIFEYQVKTLTGTRTPFKQTSIKTLIPMDKNKIYVLHSQQMRPVELLPFIRLMESPKAQQNAIYFYNRMIQEKVRWVSYHFDQESEIIRADNAVNSAVRLLLPLKDDNQKQTY